MTTDTLTAHQARRDLGRFTITAAQADYIRSIALEYGAVETAQDPNGRIYVSPPGELRADGGMWVGEDGALHLYANADQRRRGGLGRPTRAAARSLHANDAGPLVPDYQEER